MSSKSTHAAAPANDRIHRRRRPRDINVRQLAFARHYSIYGNATKAALTAGYSSKAAAVTGHRLLQNPRVAAEIARLQADRGRRCELEAHALSQRLAAIAFGDVRELFEPGTNNPIALADLPPDTQAMIASVRFGRKSGRAGRKNVVVESFNYKLGNPIPALRLLARMHGYLPYPGLPPYTGPCFTVAPDKSVAVK